MSAREELGSSKWLYHRCRADDGDGDVPAVSIRRRRALAFLRAANAGPVTLIITAAAAAAAAAHSKWNETRGPSCFVFLRSVPASQS